MNNENVNAFIVVLVFLLVAGFLFVRSRERERVLMFIGDCVEQKAEADGNGSPLPDLWNTYYQECAREYQK